MYNWKRKIKYSQFDTDVCKVLPIEDIRKQKTSDTGEIEMSYFQLLISIAKSVLTRSHKYSPQVAAFARSYMQTLPFLLDENSGYLAINYENKDVLRDFSKSTRHGEIAQGINYFYAKEKLGAYAVYDFKHYAYDLKRVGEKCTGRTPDYVLCYPNGAVGIIESKGVMVADPTVALNSACSQCQNGQDYLSKNGISVKNTYSSVVSFATNSSYINRYTQIYVVDPENDARYNDNDKNRNYLYEYSKWFYLAGNASATEKLMCGQKLSGEDFDNSDSRTIIGGWDLGGSKEQEAVRLEIGIQPSLMEYLMTDQGEEPPKYDHKIGENEEWFKDGVFLRIK